MIDMRAFKWMDRAACRNLNVAHFYPPNESNARIAFSCCDRCPVVAACKAWAVENKELGVWGGSTTLDRNAIRASQMRDRKNAKRRKTP